MNVQMATFNIQKLSGSLPGVRLPGTFMYSWTVFMPRMVCPTWLSMLALDATRINAGSFCSS